MEAVVSQVGEGGLAQGFLKAPAALPGADERGVCDLFQGQLFMVVEGDKFHHGFDAVAVGPLFFVTVKVF